jgi:peptidoglycan/LPS O-acetylase OafA/YrhL
MNQLLIKEDKSQRNHAIDLMKFFAAILITNSHMASLYPEKFKIMSTGGAIGDALFFFCSGFCLMLGSSTDFFNWYKRRINRIFPTLFAVALIGIVLWNEDPTLRDVIINFGGWFVQAIFVFYAVFWFVKRFLPNKIWVAFLIDSVIVLVWFIWNWDKECFFLKDGTYLRWPSFFMVMLSGAFVSHYINNQKKSQKEHSGWLYAGILVLLLAIYYGYQVMWNHFPIMKSFHIVLLPVLIGIIIMMYKLCSNGKVLRLYLNKRAYWLIYGISACCLEIYLIGNSCFGIGRNLIELFPLNIILTFLVIFISAYVVKIISNFLGQTFKTERYDWKGMIQL